MTSIASSSGFPGWYSRNITHTLSPRSRKSTELLQFKKEGTSNVSVAGSRS